MTSITAGDGLTGGTITISGTMAADFAGPGAATTVARSDHTHALANGSNNTGVGDGVLASNTGSDNTAVGDSALAANTTGFGNTAVGTGALAANQTGNSNTALGRNALALNTAGANTAIGRDALDANTSGNNNTAVRFLSLSANQTGLGNTAVGASALSLNTANNNTAVGVSALQSNTSGTQNTAVGAGALVSNQTGTDNIAVGQNALDSSTGSNNIALGKSAGSNLTSGDDNIYIGNFGVAAESDTIRMGSAQTATFIAGIRGVTTDNADAITVLIDSAGQLGTVSSSQRTKEKIRDMAGASAALHALRPVVFRYRRPFANGSKPLQYGLIAEEVAEVYPELVAFDAEGQPETVLYRFLAPMLLNEVQRQQAQIQEQREQAALLLRAVKEQQAQIRTLQAELAVVKAELSRSDNNQVAVLVLEE